jgi:hypothetical protein
MSSQVSGSVRLARDNRRLLRLAYSALDPQAVVRWVQAGRAGALEAARLIALTGEQRAASLRATLECGRSAALPVDAQTELAAGLESVLAASLDRHDLLELPSDDLAAPGHERVGAAADLPLAGELDDVLQTEAAVLSLAVAASFAAESFVVDEVDQAADGTLVVCGSRGAQNVTAVVDAGRRISVDVGPSGFASSAECEATRDAVVGRLAEHGLVVERARATSYAAAREAEIAAAVEEAVAQSLPGFQVRSIIEGDELQIVALPPEPEERHS